MPKAKPEGWHVKRGWDKAHYLKAGRTLCGLDQGLYAFLHTWSNEPLCVHCTAQLGRLVAKRAQ